MASVTAAACAIAGCGGGDDEPQPLAGRPDRLVNVRTVEFTSSLDQTRVTGLAAIPRTVTSRGCVIWQFGFRSTKENAELAWQGLATLGLSTFSIDLREHGARATDAGSYARVLEEPAKFRSMVRGSVADLRSAIDFLEKQPYCKRNVGYVGVSLGGAIGTIVAARDRRVKAIALVVTPGTWSEVITAPESPMLRRIIGQPDRLARALKIYRPFDPARYVAQISPRPLLILTGKSDRTVTPANALRLWRKAGGPKRRVDYRGDHNPLVGPDAARNADEVASFLLRNMVQRPAGFPARVNGTFYQPPRR